MFQCFFRVPWNLFHDIFIITVRLWETYCPRNDPESNMYLLFFYQYLFRTIPGCNLNPGSVILKL